MSRRGENIFLRKDGRWEGRYKKGRKENGKLLYGYIYGRTYEECKEKMVPFKYKYKEIMEEDDAKEFMGTMREWCMYYTEQLIKTDIRPNTYAHYNSMVQQHILPYFGDRIITSITTNEIKEFIEFLKGKPLSIGSIKTTFNIMNRMFQSAHRKGLILANPCDAIAL